MSEKEKKYWESIIKALRDTRKELKKLNERIGKRR